MCGIVGYVGEKTALPILLDGLARLEYRGYDSAGYALMSGTGSDNVDFVVRRRKGPVKELVEASSGTGETETQGISHTRWATHGVPNETNAHPHRAGDVIIVHNGIIENYQKIKDRLKAEGVHFASQTDTEVFAQLIEFIRKSIRLAAPEASAEEVLLQAMKAAMTEVVGHYAILLMDKNLPGKIYGVQNGAPLVAMELPHGTVLASDIQALAFEQRRVCFLPKGEIFIATKTGLKAENLQFETIDGTYDRAEKEHYESFMLKEIFQQSKTVAQTLGAHHWRDQVSHDELWKNCRRLILVACGTSFHAAMTAKYFFERWAKIDCQVDIASEFRYRHPILDAGTVVGVISQSGETADTLAALRLANGTEAATFSICNVSNSSIARESDHHYPTKAGPEIGVASTKAFTAQLVVLAALALDVARLKESMAADDVAFSSLAQLPMDLEKIFTQSEKYLSIGAKMKEKRMVLFIGRGTMYPIALEGALKFKELTYMPAEGFAAGELKHGSIAYIDSGTTVVVLAPRDEWYSKTVSNLEEIRARGGHIVAVGTEGDDEIARLADVFIGVPESAWGTQPILSVVPLQFLAYGCARALGRNIDQPRNLAKSVTVE
jgi:glucosamine--fructose-6-phosphate aminotransferase (isomerizing)